MIMGYRFRVVIVRGWQHCVGGVVFAALRNRARPYLCNFYIGKILNTLRTHYKNSGLNDMGSIACAKKIKLLAIQSTLEVFRNAGRFVLQAFRLARLYRFVTGTEDGI